MVMSKKRPGPYLLISTISAVTASILMFGEPWERAAGMILGGLIIVLVWIEFFFLRSTISTEGYFLTFMIGKVKFHLQHINLHCINTIHVAKKGFLIKYQSNEVEKSFGIFTRGWSNTGEFIEWFRENGIAVHSGK